MGTIVGGKAAFKVNGETIPCKGDFTYNVGRDKREAVVGIDNVHGLSLIHI